MRRLLCLLLLLSGCSTINLGEPLGEVDAEAPATPIEPLWERDADAAFGPAAAYVTGAYVVVGTRKGEVVVLDREDGAVLGRGEFGQSVEGQLGVSPDGRVLYVPTAEVKGGVEAFDVSRGVRLWRWRGGAVQGGVARVGAMVVVGMLDGRVVGLDAETGTERWTTQASGQIQAPPVVVGGDVLIADDSGRVARLDPSTGAARWAVELAQPVYAAPAVADAGVYVSTARGAVVRLDAGTGAQRWRLDTDRVLRATTASVSGDRLAVGFTDGSTRVLDAATGAERWRHTIDGNVGARPAWVGDALAVGTMDERLLVLDGATGRELTASPLRGRVKSALAVGGGLLIVLIEPRHVVAFHAAP